MILKNPRAPLAEWLEVELTHTPGSVGPRPPAMV